MTWPGVVGWADELGIDFWIGGGWAVDIHLGRGSRGHSDVDLVVDWSDRRVIHDALSAEGFIVVNDEQPDAELVYERDHLRVDVTFIGRGDEGIITPGWESWPWPQGAFSEEPMTLMGVVACSVSAETLAATKREWESHTGEAPRSHDIADIQSLRKRSK